MASHADDHARAKRLLEEIIKLSSSVENVVRRNGETAEDFRRRLNDMTNRAARGDVHAMPSKVR